MVVSTRALWTLGLGLIGLGVMAGPTFGQQDTAVRKTTTQSTAPVPPAPATFGTVDIQAVFKGYEKVKATSEEFKTAVMARQNELMKSAQEMKLESEKLAKMAPGSVDFKKVEDRMTQLKADIEARREQAEREFSVREAEMLSTLYKEIQSMVGRVAKHRSLNYVLKVSNDPVNGADPNSAMRAIDRSVVYADSQNDITADVVRYLNVEYRAASGASPKAGASAASAAPSAAKPRGN